MEQLIARNFCLIEFAVNEIVLGMLSTLPKITSLWKHFFIGFDISYDTSSRNTSKSRKWQNKFMYVKYTYVVNA